MPERLIGTDCKSVALRLRWFESTSLHHHAHVAQLAERVLGKDKVTGSTPVVGSKKGKCGMMNDEC